MAEKISVRKRFFFLLIDNHSPKLQIAPLINLENLNGTM